MWIGIKPQKQLIGVVTFILLLSCSPSFYFIPPSPLVWFFWKLSFSQKLLGSRDKDFTEMQHIYKSNLKCVKASMWTWKKRSSCVTVVVALWNQLLNIFWEDTQNKRYSSVFYIFYFLSANQCPPATTL